MQINKPMLIDKKTEENFKVAQLTKWGFEVDKHYTLGKIDAKFKNIWLEVKKSGDDVYDMLAQIIFTAYRENGKYRQLPPYLGCFNDCNGAVIAKSNVYDIMRYKDMNWEQTPSKIDDKTVGIIKNLLTDVREFNLDDFGIKLKEIESTEYLQQDDITKTTFVLVYQEWLKAVGSIISFGTNDDIENLKPDCFLADLMVSGNKTITDKLRVVSLMKFGGDCVYITKQPNEMFSEIKITDQKAYQNFWSRYKRPPEEQWQEFILNRRDLLQPIEKRQRKGEFYTPEVWSMKSKIYFEKIFGANWQDKYWIWDCCCGTGRLEEGLINPERVFMSTLDQEDIDIIKHKKFMQDAAHHPFQFNFVDDEWKPKKEGGKIPDKLWKVIKEEPQNVLIYINPPYAEASNAKQASGTGEAKDGVSDTLVKKEMVSRGLGKAGNDLFAQFYFRIYTQIKGCKVGVFSKLKNCNGSNYAKFREAFPYKFCGGFMCRADTFDNVTGQFPIGFQLWDSSIAEERAEFTFDVLNNDGEFVNTKKIYNLKKGEFINDWFKTNNRSTEEVLCVALKHGNDFQHNNGVALYKEAIKSHNQNKITKSNLIDGLIYVAVRHCIKATWLNDRDQFTKPKKQYDNTTVQDSTKYAYEEDQNFINNCVVFALLHAQNNTNWQFFKNSEIDVSEARDMEIYELALKGQKFSETASRLLETGRQVYTLYHKNFNNPNAGRKTVWQSLKNHDEFKPLNKSFLEIQKQLAGEIADDAHTYGFLKI